MTNMHETISWKSDPRTNFRHHNSRDRGGAGNHLRVVRVDLDRRRRRWKRSVTAIRVFVQSEQRKKQGGATAKMLTGTTSRSSPGPVPVPVPSAPPGNIRATRAYDSFIAFRQITGGGDKMKRSASRQDLVFLISGRQENENGCPGGRKDSASITPDASALKLEPPYHDGSRTSRFRVPSISSDFTHEWSGSAAFHAQHPSFSY
ncbi:hypothetical protein EUGRSUZ_G03203 [Eucalyptus grandis]|uniref:Uncharacterized protein n=2 Tax=Eucalyptus grandis TaxID=71139 RepID=A0ACC3K9A5_EUCGR|nr:hypothetical protein EUGRSUZ_G03203 [Eucalyptus grandis]